MMQFQHVSHYTVDEHLLRCIGVNEIEHGDKPEFSLASELIKTTSRSMRRAVRRLVPARHRQGRVEDLAGRRALAAGRPAFRA